MQGTLHSTAPVAVASEITISRQCTQVRLLSQFLAFYNLLLLTQDSLQLDNPRNGIDFFFLETKEYFSHLFWKRVISKTLQLEEHRVVFPHERNNDC